MKKLKQVLVRLPPEEYEKLKKAAHKAEVSMTIFIRQAILEKASKK